MVGKGPENMFVLPTNTISASQTRPGVVKVGSGINVTSDGTLSFDDTNFSVISVKGNIVDTVAEAEVNTNIISIDVDTSGNYLVFVYYTVDIQDTKLTVNINYNDKRGPRTQTVINGSNGIPAGSYIVDPLYIYSESSSKISVIFQSDKINSVYANASVCRL